MSNIKIKRSVLDKLREGGDPPKKYDWDSMVNNARQKSIDYLQSPEWTERSGGYDPSKLIKDTQNAEVIVDPSKFPKPGRGSQIVRGGTNPVLQLDVQQATRLGNPQDLINHEVGHLGYPNFGKSTPEIEKQKLEMLRKQTGYKKLTEEDTPAAQFYQENFLPFHEQLAKGELTAEQYTEQDAQARQKLMQMFSGTPQERAKARGINKMINQYLPKAPHEIRQQIIEKRNNPDIYNRIKINPQEIQQQVTPTQMKVQLF